MLRNGNDETAIFWHVNSVIIKCWPRHSCSTHIYIYIYIYISKSVMRAYQAKIPNRSYPCNFLKSPPKLKEACFESMLPGSWPQDLPLPCRFPQSRSPHGAGGLHFQAQTVVPDHLAHFQTHQVQPHPVGHQAMQNQARVHQWVHLIQCWWQCRLAPMHQWLHS